MALADAVLGERDSALREAERAIMLSTSLKMPGGPAYEEVLALIQTVLGENSRAISTLTRLLKTPYGSFIYGPAPVTPALLRLDPFWDPLRADPAFQKLCEEKQPLKTRITRIVTNFRRPTNWYKFVKLVSGACSVGLAFERASGMRLLFVSIASGRIFVSHRRRALPKWNDVIVTGSNIPTAEEIGPNPVDTYRPADIEKLGIRNATDLQTFLPQEAGSTLNLNMGNGDGTVQINLRGLLPRETLVLVDGKRVAFGSLGGAGSSEGEDINLIPFPMIDHIDILKDGASAVYGSDAIAGVINFFLIHKFRGLEIGGTATGTQTWEHPTTWASGKHG